MTPNDVKIVADNIDDFIEVPNGIEKLRQAVLTLAVSGKIVPQVKSEKITEGINESANTKIPFDIPKSWKWVDFAEVFDIHGGTQPPKKDFVYEPKQGYVRLLQIRDFGERGVPTYVRVESVRRFCKPEDILIGRYGASVGRICSGMEGAYNVALAKVDFLHSSLEREYAKIYFLQDYFQSKLLAISRSAQAGFNKEDLSKFVFPYPPVTEQKRIVKKVEELMRQLDELEVKKRERDEVCTRLARSAMQSLGRGESKIAFEQLTELVKTPSDIKELENALLTLAVSGKLTQQNKSDGTSEDLFNQILSKRVRVKKQVPVGEKDQLFPIPSSWSWVRLEDVFDVRDGTHDSPKYHDNGYPLITSKNLYYGSLDFLNVKYISENDHKKISERSKVDRDDVLFAMIGSIGNPVIVDTDTEFSIKNVALFKYYDRKLSEPVFLLTYLKYATQNMRAVSAGGVQSFVSLGFLRQYPFPLPPLAEQRRIVKKVEEVTALIDHLKQLIG